MTAAVTEQTALMRRDEPSTLMLIQQAIESGVDAEKMRELMELHERHERNEAAKAFADAIASFQADCPPITKKREAQFKGTHAYNFASLDDIMKIVQPLLTAHGLAVAFSATVDGGAIVAECRVRCGIHVELTTITLPVPSEMRVNATQKMGAAFSYAKRYALCAALNITVTDEDNDGDGLVEPVTGEQANTLINICSECAPGTEKRFLVWMGVPSFHDVPAAKFNEAKAKLYEKRKTFQESQ